MERGLLVDFVFSEAEKQPVSVQTHRLTLELLQLGDLFLLLFAVSDVHRHLLRQCLLLDIGFLCNNLILTLLHIHYRRFSLLNFFKHLVHRADLELDGLINLSHHF